MEGQARVSQKLCEIEGADDFNCVDCPDFDGCQMILYDSYDDMESDESYDENDLTIV